MIVYP